MRSKHILSWCALAAFAAGPVAAQYCSFSITNPCGGNEYMSSVSFGTIANTSGCGAAGYEDWSAQTATFQAGTSFNVSVVVSSWFSTGDTIRMFCDWNNNLTLNDPGEEFLIPQVGPGVQFGSATYGGTVAVPTTATIATVRARIAMVWNSTPTPCGPFGFGEAEDYSVNIVAPFTLTFTDLGSHNMRIDIDNGPSFGGYFMPITFYAGQFPNGWFYGLDASFGELISEAGAFPFSGPLDAVGHFGIGPFGIPGGLNGLPIYALGLAFSTPGLGVPALISTPVSFTLP